MSGYRALLRGNERFRRLWTAEVISFLGDWFNTIALYTIVQERAYKSPDKSISWSIFSGVFRESH